MRSAATRVGQRIGEVLVLAAAEPVARHDDAAAERRVGAYSAAQLVSTPGPPEHRSARSPRSPRASSSPRDAIPVGPGHAARSRSSSSRLRRGPSGSLPRAAILAQHAVAWNRHREMVAAHASPTSFALAATPRRRATSRVGLGGAGRDLAQRAPHPLLSSDPRRSSGSVKAGRRVSGNPPPG